MKHFRFDQVLSGFFHADADVARAMLPAPLALLQPHAGVAIANVAVFDFSHSEVGAYMELVISLAVVPWAGREEALPAAAFYPVFLATSTPASRDYAQQHWHLPRHEATIAVSFAIDGPLQQAAVSQDGEPLLALRLQADADYLPARRVYQSFSRGAGAVHRFPVTVEGGLSEHEDQKGSLVLGSHPGVSFLRELIQEKVPFREQRMLQGEEYLGDLTLHASTRGQHGK